MSVLTSSRHYEMNSELGQRVQPYVVVAMSPHQMSRCGVGRVEKVWKI